MRPHAAALAGCHTTHGTDSVGGAPCRPQRRPHRSGNPMLKSGISREIRGIICGGEERSRRPARSGKTAPNVRCGDAVRMRSSSPGSIRRRRSGGPPAEPAHRQPRLIPKIKKKKERAPSTTQIPRTRILSELDDRKRPIDD